MKQFVSILLIVILAFSCQTEEQIPTDLKGKKAFLLNKKKELKELQNSIDELTADIEKEEPPKAKPRKNVSARKIVKQDFNRFSEIQANVEADEPTYASSETGGRIVSMNIKEGDYVKKGQLIAKMDMESVNKQIAELKTSRGLAQDLYDRQKRLWDQKIGTEMQFLQAKNNLERIDKSLETIQYQLTKANVYAPSSGYAEMVMAKSGEVAGPGTPIIQILNTSKLKVVASLSENYLGKIKRGQTVDVNFPALELETKAKVSQLGRTIDPANRTFKVELNVPNSKGQLKPNLLATILVNDYSAKDVVVLPLELVQEEISGKKYVMIATKEGDADVATKKYVETGESYQSQIEILTGLNGDEIIIVDGARTLADQELIEVSLLKDLSENKKQ